MSPPRLRMFAGPNGSGKSTFKTLLPAHLLGVYINPDEIEAEIRLDGVWHVEGYGVTTDASEILPFFVNHPLLERAELRDEALALRFTYGKLSFFNVSVNAYFASVCADFLRRKLLEAGRSLSFETVMSSPDKVTLLERARAQGYRTYLYYVATEDPEINLARVARRVLQGGHGVPADKVVSRYWRSLELLLPALMHADRAYVFDNSGATLLWLAEVTGGQDIVLRSETLPQWFRVHVWDKLNPGG